MATCVAKQLEIEMLLGQPLLWAHEQLDALKEQFLFHICPRGVAANGTFTGRVSHVTDAIPWSINFTLFSSIVKYLC